MVFESVFPVGGSRKTEGRAGGRGRSWPGRRGQRGSGLRRIGARPDEGDGEPGKPGHPTHRRAGKARAPDSSASAAPYLERLRGSRARKSTGHLTPELMAEDRALHDVGNRAPTLKSLLDLRPTSATSTSIESASLEVAESQFSSADAASVKG